MARRTFVSAVRPTATRSPNRIFVISVEGKVDETKYFNQVIQTYSLNVRFQFVFATPDQNESAPNHVLERLTQKVKETRGFNPKTGDQAWLVMDVDSWKKTLNEAITYAEKYKYRIAISNKSFNTWINMHNDKGACIPSKECELTNCKHCEYHVRSKTFKNIMQYVPNAIKFAKSNDTKNCRNPIPPCPGSGIYKLLQELGIDENTKPKINEPKR